MTAGTSPSPTSAAGGHSSPAAAAGDSPAAAGASPFTPDVIEAIKRHMNGDHADDCGVIVRGLGGQPTATSATMSGMDADGMDFIATVDGEPVPARVPFTQTLTERRQVRAEAARMYREACAKLGTEPRADAT